MKNVTYINASAGSGKTYKLTHLLAELIEKKEVRPEQVIMTTFSVKAANEMKEEAKKVLYASKLFDEATRIDQAMIGTIHSVAQQMIKKYWFFLGLSPDMGVMDENDTKFYVSQSLGDLPTNEQLEDLHDFCEYFEIGYSHYIPGQSGLNYDFWKEDIQKVITYTTNYEIDNYERSIKESLDFIRQFVDHNVKTGYSKEYLTTILDAQKRYAESQRDSKKKQDALDDIQNLRRGTAHPTIGWYKRLSKQLGTWTDCAPEAVAIRDELSSMWHWPEVYELQEKYIKLLFGLADLWKKRYSTYKKEKNLLDFNDMEKFLRDLLNDERVSKEIAADYRYLFVDEYQDCSPIQVKIFDRLSELMKQSYWVGDYKQAIYGFRGSDITLPKAVVDRISTGKDGCKMAKPLDTSYRSLPDIVNVCNKTFEQTFEGVLDRNAIVLKEHRENKEGITSLRYWKLPDAGDKAKADDHKKAQKVGLACHIAHLIKDEGAKPNEIAVLNRANAPMNELAGELKGLGIPASREDMPVLEMQAAPLVMALLSLIASENDPLAKAQIAYLTEEDIDTRALIERKLLFDMDESNRQKDFLNDVPLVKRMLQLRPMLKQQSLAAQVETMFIELDLYNVVKKIGDVAESVSCLNTIISAAGTYEQHCQRMALPATASGFMDYLAVAKPAGVGDANGVQLHTYHSSKGLQWKYVILTSLRSKADDSKKCVSGKIYGVHFNYAEQPSAENPYPEVYIRIMPWIYGSSNSSVDQEIEQKIEESPLFLQIKADSLSEDNRLMYVGMTRPQDVMILALEKPGRGCHALQWLQDIGLDSVNPEADSDLLGVGCHFKNDTLSADQLETMKEYKYQSLDEKLKTHHIPYQKPLCEEDKKYISPSTLHEKGELVEHYDICNRMKVGSLVGHTSAEAGDCLHQIYCGIEEHIDDKMYYNQLIESYGLTRYFIDAQAIRIAWESLMDWLTTEFGAAVKVYHERPFTLLREGRVLTGSIDLVWQTNEGDVLIDFKSCPMTDNYILNPESDHYAGWYAGQLDAYTDALEAAGEKVIKRFIYYPVSGMACEISRAFDRKPPYDENVFHVFGIEGLVMNDLWDEAIHFCNDDGFFGEIKIFEEDTKQEGVESYNTLLCGASTQGVHVTYMHKEDTHLHIELPWLGSIGDVKLAFALMKALQKMYPDCGIFMDDNTEGQFAVIDDNYDAMVTRRLINMRSLVESPNSGEHMGAPGFYHDLIAPSKEDYPDMEIEDVVFKAHDMFVELQWAYQNYFSASKADVTSPDGEKFIVRFLTNAEDTFVGICQHVCLMSNKEVKDIPVHDFFKIVEGNPYFKKVDAGQFVLQKMPDDEWQKLYDAIDAKPMSFPKTYLLRWNPGISSFKLETYRKAMTECPDGFGLDWSIFEWEEAHEGDRYYMLRTGDEKSGIVWHGVFTSDPYEDKDWAGQGKQRHYMKMDCCDCVPADQKPPVDIEMLEKEIPEIDWRKGHSGQLLSEETAEKLDELWNEHNNIEQL